VRHVGRGSEASGSALVADLHLRRGCDNIKLIHRNPWFGTDQV
jgi:hypothetical protein